MKWQNGLNFKLINTTGSPGKQREGGKKTKHDRLIARKKRQREREINKLRRGIIVNGRTFKKKNTQLGPQDDVRLYIDN